LGFAIQQAGGGEADDVGLTEIFRDLDRVAFPATVAVAKSHSGALG
jgi:hypothetical protein